MFSSRSIVATTAATWLPSGLTLGELTHDRPWGRSVAIRVGGVGSDVGVSVTPPPYPRHGTSRPADPGLRAISAGAAALGSAEQLELLPGGRDLADELPSEAPTFARTADLHPFRPQRTCGAVG